MTLVLSLLSLRYCFKSALESQHNTSHTALHKRQVVSLVQAVLLHPFIAKCDAARPPALADKDTLLQECWPDPRFASPPQDAPRFSRLTHTRLIKLSQAFWGAFPKVV